MATKLALKAKEAFVQYSKKMCTRVTIFWMIYRIANFIVVLLRPETSGALVALMQGADTIMIVNMSVYTGNSITEKAVLAFSSNKNASYKPEEEEEEEEESSNG